MAALKTLNGVAEASVKTYNGIANASWKTWNALTIDSTFLVDGADFDGTNDWVKRGGALTGVADGKLGLCCYWVRLDGGDAANMNIIRGSVALLFRRASSNKFEFLLPAAVGGASALVMATVGTYTAGATWRWVAASWDMSDTAKRHLYIGDTSDISVTTYSNVNLDYTDADYGVGASPGGVSKLNGCLAEVFWFPNVYLDLSVEANRRLFYSATGKPVDPAAAITALGAPAIYMHLDDGETANNFAANDDGGTGGTFTVTGALDTSTTSPSD